MTALGSDLPLRDRIIESAADLAARRGWASLTMSAVGTAAGVSRQTVYNEVGSKPQLAQAVVLRELGAFLAMVDRGFDENPGDVVAAIRSAVSGILELADGNPLVREILSGTSEANADLLPLLTTRSSDVLEMACETALRRLRPLTPHLDEGHRRAAVDVLVRSVLSHVTRPAMRPDAAAENVAWAAGRMVSA